MATHESPTHTPLTTLVAVAAVTAECLMHEASANDVPEPIWHDPAWLATIDDTTLGEGD
jgi:hypothetical protein